jgi:hypothetical protein
MVLYNDTLLPCSRIWIRGWFSLSALLGVTWLFGLAYIEFNHSFVYIFVVLNGFQVRAIPVPEIH